MLELHNGLIKVAGSSFGINSKPVLQIPFGGRRNICFNIKITRQNTKHIAVDNGTSSP
jgi:hypothetical protein